MKVADLNRILFKIFGSILMALAWSPATAQLRCEESLQEAQNTSLRHQFARVEFGHLLRASEQMNLRHPSGRLFIVEKKTYESEHFFTEVLHIDPSQTQSKTHKKVSDTNLAHYQHITQEIMDFVLATYSERRTWPPSFRQKLRDNAKKYQWQTTRIVVRNKNHNDDPGEILGTISFVQVDNRAALPRAKLPVEDYFGFELPTSHGVKVEPGGFAIKRDVNKPVFGELLAQTLLYTKNLEARGVDLNEKFIFTYADKFSRLMYSFLGFKTKREIPVLHRDEIQWQVLQQSGTGLRDILNRLTQIKSWREDEVHSLQQHVQDVIDSRHNPSDSRSLVSQFVSGHSTRPRHKPPQRAYLARRVRQRPSGAYEQLIVGSDSTLDFGFELPQKVLQHGLREGQKLVDFYGSEIEYREQILHVTQELRPTRRGQRHWVEVEISASADLHTVHSIKYGRYVETTRGQPEAEEHHYVQF